MKALNTIFSFACTGLGLWYIFHDNYAAATFYLILRFENDITEAVKELKS